MQSRYTQSMQTDAASIGFVDDEQTLLREFAANENLDLVIPHLARDRQAMRRIEAVVRN